MDVEEWASDSAVWSVRTPAVVQSGCCAALGRILPWVAWLVFDVCALGITSLVLLVSNRDTMYYGAYVLCAWLGSLVRCVGARVALHLALGLVVLLAFGPGSTPPPVCEEANWRYHTALELKRASVFLVLYKGAPSRAGRWEIVFAAPRLCGHTNRLCPLSVPEVATFERKVTIICHAIVEYAGTWKQADVWLLAGRVQPVPVLLPPSGRGVSFGDIAGLFGS